MSKSRKIYLYSIAVIFAGLEVLNGVTGYIDRSSSFFKGLAVMILEIFLIPIILGLLWGIFEATSCLEEPSSPVFAFYKKAFRDFGFSCLRALGIFTLHGVISPIVATFTLGNDIYEYLSSCGLVLLWSLGVGLGSYLVFHILTKLVIAAIRETKRSYAYFKLRREEKRNGDQNEK